MVTDEESGGEIPDAPGEDAQPAAAAEGTRANRLVFPVAGFGLLLRQESAMEFLEDQTPYHIPNRHPLFEGLINRRGSLVPVFEIRTLFGAGVDDHGLKNILAIGSGADAVGIILDDTPYRVFLDEDEKLAPPERVAEVFGEFVEECVPGDRGERFTRVAMEGFLYDLVHEPT